MHPIHHIGYVADDLSAGIDRAVTTLGTGPFFLIEHLRFDEVTYLGEPAHYDHSSAFAAWGPILIELTQIHDARPDGLRRALGSGGPRPGHVAWLADSLEEETARLDALGIRPFHSGRTGPASAVWFDGTAVLGHHIEVLQRADPLLEFYGQVRDAAAEWDGSEPVRPVG